MSTVAWECKMVVLHWQQHNSAITNKHILLYMQPSHTLPKCMTGRSLILIDLSHIHLIRCTATVTPLLQPLLLSQC